MSDKHNHGPASSPQLSSSALADLRRQLNRLGVVPGSQFRPKSPAHPKAAIEALVPGQVCQTLAGPCFQVTHQYMLDTQHGSFRLADWLDQDLASLSLIGGSEVFSLTDIRHFVFLDVETTGLGIGGSLAFLVGAGFFNTNGQFEIRQWFLRDPAEEQAMLEVLLETLQSAAGLVTFNGRNFDVPILASRCILARRPARLNSLPNLDLLPPARRLWRRRLPSCALKALEADVLGVRRSHADVPGYLIPTLYQDYLRTGDAHEMVRVLYHNEMDILSMVVLGAVIRRAVKQPADPSLPVDDRISLARWYLSQQMYNHCEAAYRSVLDEADDLQTRYEALYGLANLLKSLGRRHEAVPLWIDLADLKVDTFAHEELAKHYEWHVVDLSLALFWTEAGIALAETWRPSLRRTQTLSALYHRRQRLKSKLAVER